MKKFLAILAGIVALGAAIIGMQSTKQVQLQWDPMPITETWQAVRIYNIQGTETLLGTVPCLAGPPISCPTSITLVINKQAYSIVARSWNGDWESSNSNTVVLAGPPVAPTGLKK